MFLHSAGFAIRLQNLILGLLFYRIFIKKNCRRCCTSFHASNHFIFTASIIWIFFKFGNVQNIRIITPLVLSINCGYRISKNSLYYLKFFVSFSVWCVSGMVESYFGRLGVEFIYSCICIFIKIIYVVPNTRIFSFFLIIFINLLFESKQNHFFNKIILFVYILCIQ